MKKRILFASLLLIVLSVCIAVILVTRPRKDEDRKIADIVYFDQVVTENGTDRMCGYYGWVINPGGKYWYSRHSYVSVLPSVDIQKISLLANACGYETALVTEPLEYDPLQIQRVVVKHRVLLYPNNVSILFSIILLENGYLTVKVNSDYFLREDWMRSVFQKVFQDISLPPNTISLFELPVNWLGTAG